MLLSDIGIAVVEGFPHLLSVFLVRWFESNRRHQFFNNLGHVGGSAPGYGVQGTHKRNVRRMSCACSGARSCGEHCRYGDGACRPSIVSLTLLGYPFEGYTRDPGEVSHGSVEFSINAVTTR